MSVTKYRVFGYEMLHENFWEEADSHGELNEEYYVVEIPDDHRLASRPEEWLWTEGYVM